MEYRSNALQVIFSLDDFNNVNDVLDGINSAYPGGGANMAEALRIARQNMFSVVRTGVPSSIVLLSSGYATQRYYRFRMQQSWFYIYLSSQFACCHYI
jgi:hypothetical protein